MLSYSPDFCQLIVSITQSRSIVQVCCVYCMDFPLIIHTMLELVVTIVWMTHQAKNLQQKRNFLC